MEAAVTEYRHTGKVREAAGSAYAGVAPTNTYQTGDGEDIVIGGNSDALFPRLMHLVGRDDLGADERYRTNPGRFADAPILDRAIADWTGSHTLADCLAGLEGAGVPAGPIYTVADIASDPQYAARDMLLERTLDDGTPIVIPGIVPRMAEAPGSVDRLGQVQLGADNDEVYGGLGIDERERAVLRAEGII